MLDLTLLLCPSISDRRTETKMSAGGSIGLTNSSSTVRLSEAFTANCNPD